MKRTLLLAARLTALTLILFFCSAVAAHVSGLQGEPGQRTGTIVLTFLLVCLLQAAVLFYLMARSRWFGWRLVGTIFLVFFGVTSVMSQIETAVFVPRLPPGTVPRIVLMGGITAALFAPFAVLLMGKRRAQRGEQEPGRASLIRRGGWWARAVLVAAVYVVLYFTFGYFVAWRDPAVRAFYGGAEPAGFLPNMAATLRDQLWLPLFQLARGLMWVALAWLIMQMMKGKWWEAGLGVALSFAVLMNAQLLLPNPFMPEAVRMTHLVETASSNFLFGWIAAWVLRPKWSPAGSA